MVRSSFNHLVATAFIVGRCEASVRLVSGSGVPLSADSLSGLLQMAVNGNWKYVCDDHFMDTSHGAEVACRELGFRGGSHSAERTVPSDFFYDDIVCSGHEARLQDCPRSSDENCGTTEGVFLTCLEALAIGNERTGYCQNGLASNAWTSGTTVTMEECQALCQQGCQGISYDQSRSFCMTCSTTDDITDTGSLTWKLYDKASPASVRLVSGSSIPLSADSLSGLLQMAVNGNWKYVCDDLFIDNSHGAEVACRELGFRGGSHSAGTAPSDDSFYDEIACSGHEARLQDCPRSSDENCGATEAVFLTCLEAVSSCSIATDLATETSPFSGNTIDGSDTLSPTCGGQGGKEKIFYIDVPATYKLTIGMTSTDYDSRHETRWGGSCPGENSVACTDDPNTYAHQWQNDQGYSQHVYFHIDAFSSASGNFVLEWSITKAVGTCSSGSECESGYCRGGVCCNANGASEGCRECYSATNGDCKTCATGYYLTSNYQCQEASYCLRITTGNGANQDGPLDVSVDSGSGLVSESSGTWGQGALVLQKCYPNNILSLQVQNTANNAWAGSIEYSVNGGATYQPMICRDCTGSQVDTMLIVVDGNTDGAEQAPTHCLGGSACIISQAWGCHIGAGSACKTCVDQVHRTSDTNCATCNDGYLESSQTCQATCVNFSCPINYVIQNPVSTNYTQENCCQATCAEYDCPSNYVIRNLSSTNYTQESCCQATCAEYDCPSNYLIQNPTSTTYTEGECCQGTCAAFPCPSNYVIQNPVSTEYTQENCCQATCAAFPCPSNSLTQNLTSTIYIEANCCEACWAGSYYTDDGVEECKACSAGRHSSTSGASHCLACSAGTYASTSGASQCEECSAGRHSPTLGAATCQACSAGKYSSSNASNCSLCSAGTYSPTLGATECHNCSSGNFSSTPGHSQCRTCQVGRHASSFGASECEANQCTCSEGSAVPAGDSNCTVDDAEVCGSCNPGYTLNSNLCQAWACTMAGGTGCLTCESEASRTTINHCASCNDGYQLVGTSCQAPTTTTIAIATTTEATSTTTEAATAPTTTAIVTSSIGSVSVAAKKTYRITVDLYIANATDVHNEEHLMQKLASAAAAASPNATNTAVVLHAIYVTSLFGNLSLIVHDDIIAAYANMTRINISEIRVNNRTHSTMSGGGRRLLEDTQAEAHARIPNSYDLDVITESRLVASRVSASGLTSLLKAAKPDTYANLTVNLQSRPDYHVSVTTEVAGTTASVTDTGTAVTAQLANIVPGARVIGITAQETEALISSTQSPPENTTNTSTTSYLAVFVSGTSDQSNTTTWFFASVGVLVLLVVISLCAYWSIVLRGRRFRRFRSNNEVPSNNEDTSICSNIVEEKSAKEERSTMDNDIDVNCTDIDIGFDILADLASEEMIAAKAKDAATEEEYNNDKAVDL